MTNVFSEAIHWIESEFTKAWTAITHANAQEITAAVAQDAQLIANGLETTLSAFSAVTGTDTTKVQALIADINDGLQKIVAGVSANLAKPVIQQVADDWATFTSTIAPVLSSLPGAAQEVIKAVTVLIPYVTAAANLVGAPEAVASVEGGFTPDQARVILGAAGK